MTWADQIARLRVARSTGRLPADLAEWLLTELAAAAPSADRQDARNALLRQAAQHMPGSTWARAGMLAAEIEALPRRHGKPRDIVAELIRAALDIDPSCPRGQRQLLRIIAA